MWNSFQNDLAYITDEEIYPYAYDHQIFASGSSTSIVEGKLLSEGSKITRWYKENLLQVNVQKYQSTVLGAESEAHNINLHIVGVNIKQLISIKFFGVLLDSELNFCEHISSLSKKASQQIGVLRLLRKLIPTHAKLQLYKAAILPHLTYCSTVWNYCRATDKRKVEGLQERSPRVVFNNESVSYDELLWLAELPSLVNRRLQEITILMFKTKKNQLPSQIQELFMLKTNSDRRYSLRNSDFNLPRFNTIKYGKHSLRYYGPLAPFPLVETYKGVTCAEDSLCRFKTKMRRTDPTTFIEDSCRNSMLCNN